MTQLQSKKTHSPREKVKAIAATLARIDDGRTMEEKARALSISRSTLYRWSKKAEVREELEKYLDVEFYALAREIVHRLAQRALAGNSKAIQLYLELAGMYNPVR